MSFTFLVFVFASNLLYLAVDDRNLGTIKHTQLAAIEHNREVVARYRARAKTPGEFHNLVSIRY